MMRSITSDRIKKRLQYALAAAFWLALWQAGSMAMGRQWLLPSPAAVVEALVAQLQKAEFWRIVVCSCLRIVGGFVLALSLGVLLAALSARFYGVRILLSPVVSLVKATPVASFIILILLWVRSQNIATPVCFLMVFPILYSNTLAGFDAVDKKLLEMAKVFDAPKLRSILYIYLPGAMPFLLSGCRVGMGICWKSGVAAEVIGQSSATIGGNLYQSKLFLEVPEMFAWTAVIILVSSLIERLTVALLRRVGKWVGGSAL